MLYQEINLPIWAELVIMAILSIVIIFLIRYEPPAKDVDDRQPLYNPTFVEKITGKLCGDKGYISQSLFENLLKILSSLKKNDIIDGNGFSIKEGETSPPKRYNSGSMILAMENAGQLIEDEELRAQIKGSGIGRYNDTAWIQIIAKCDLLVNSRRAENGKESSDNDLIYLCRRCMQ